jgi:hypothetical protein
VRANFTLLTKNKYNPSLNSFYKVNMSQPQPVDPNVKNITVTGAAATHQAGGQKRRRRAAATQRSRAAQAGLLPDVTGPTQRSRQQGGSSEASESSSKINVIQQLASSIPPAAASAPSLISAVAAATTQPGSTQQGGANKQNVKLVPAKSKNKTRVLLSPKSTNNPVTQQTGGSKTRKQKKLSLRVSNIRRKVASTRKHIHASTALPIDKIRKELVDAKLLNPASKAPEALIRKIYADFKITTHKA